MFSKIKNKKYWHYYPLRNSAIDPTNAAAPIRSTTGYQFVSNDGIYTRKPVTDLSSCFEGNAAFNDADVSLWDTFRVNNMSRMFINCNTFNQSVSNFKTKNVTSFNEMFSGCPAFNNGQASGQSSAPLVWDTANVNNMSSMFFGALIFNQAVSSWNTSSVSSMSQMFQDAQAFNQNISGWNVSNNTNFASMFNGAIAYNNGGSPLSWTRSGTTVSSMSNMFRDANAFNVAVSGFNTTNVNDMASMFFGTTIFNQSISTWNLSSVTTFSDMFRNTLAFNNGGVAFAPARDGTTVSSMNNMFRDADAFNVAVSGFNTVNVNNMAAVFAGAALFNQSINTWNLSAVTSFASMFNLTGSFNNGGVAFAPTRNGTTSATMASMFTNADAFNVAVSGFNTTNVTSMNSMFAFTNIFNQSISAWNLSSVTDMSSMFWETPAYDNGGVAFAPTRDGTTACVMASLFRTATAFNQDVSGFNIANTTSLAQMFDGALTFNQPLSSWDVSAITNMDSMFQNAGAFNQDLTDWATPFILVTEPTNFATGATFFEDINRPIWTATPGYAFDVDTSVAGTSGVNFFGFYFNGTSGNIEWGDGTNTVVTAANLYQHNYGTAGTFTVNVTLGNGNATPGTSQFGAIEDGAKIVEIRRIKFDANYTTTIATRLFAQITAVTDWRRVVSLDTSSLTDMSSVFNSASFNESINGWNLSNVTSMVSMFFNSLFNNGGLAFAPTRNGTASTQINNMFSSATAFNVDVSGFNTTNVTNVSQMFRGATSFNQSINTFNLNNANSMSLMFYDATNFNNGGVAFAPTRDGSTPASMSTMFFNADAFNVDVSGFNTTGVNNFSGCFQNTLLFNQSINNWNLSSAASLGTMFTSTSAYNNGGVAFAPTRDGTTASSMSNMFNFATSFNVDVSGFNTANVTSMGATFNGASSFNQSVNSWNMDSVTSFDFMFQGTAAYNNGGAAFSPTRNGLVSATTQNMFENTPSFNASINSFNTTNITNMTSMFDNAAIFNQPLSVWDVSSVTNMDNMFNGSLAFNQDISDWNVSSVTSMIGMFQGAIAFDKDLRTWSVSSIPTQPALFDTGATNWSKPRPIWGTTGIFRIATSVRGPLTENNLNIGTGNRRVWSSSVWLRKSMSAGPEVIFEWGGCTITSTIVGGTERVEFNDGGDTYIFQDFPIRDPGSWNHYLFTCNTNEAATIDRLKFYYSGNRVTNNVTGTFFTSGQATSVGAGGNRPIIRSIESPWAERHYVENIELTPSDFGFTDTANSIGSWEPSQYTGPWNGIGYYLPGTDDANIGTDASGNANNFNITAIGTGRRVLADSPTNTFATLNSIAVQQLDTGSSATTETRNGLLSVFSPSAGVPGEGQSTHAIDLTSGRNYYWEINLNSIQAVNAPIGVYNSLTNTTYSVNATATGTYGFALNSGTGVLTINLNGALLTTVSSITGKVVPYITGVGAQAEGAIFNFGQDSSFAGALTVQTNSDTDGVGEFQYAVPANHYAINTANLVRISTPYSTYTIPTSGTEEGAYTYVGTGVARGRFVALGYRPSNVVIDDVLYTFPDVEVTSQGVKIVSAALNTLSTSYTLKAWVEVDGNIARKV